MHMRRTADRLFGRENYHWSVLGAGRNQMPIAAMAAAMGGNVRVGLEDSLWIGPGKLAESNAAAGHQGAPDHRGAGARDRDARRGARDPGAQGRRQGEFLSAAVIPGGRAKRASPGPIATARFRDCASPAPASRAGIDREKEKRMTITVNAAAIKEASKKLSNWGTLGQGRHERHAQLRHAAGHRRGRQADQDRARRSRSAFRSTAPARRPGCSAGASIRSTRCSRPAPTRSPASRTGTSCAMPTTR